jgi:hypothetical protein
MSCITTVFAHSSRCAVRRRRFHRRSLRNSSGVLGCGVHVLGDAARRCRPSLGLAPLNAKSLGGHSGSQALVLGPCRLGVFHRAKAHCPCALWVPVLGERAPALDQVVDRAASETRSEEGFLDVGHELREELVRACRLDHEDAILVIKTRSTPRNSVRWGTRPASWARPRLSSGPADVVATAPETVGLGSPDAIAGVPLTVGAEVTGAGAADAAWNTGSYSAREPTRTGADGADVTV